MLNLCELTRAVRVLQARISGATVQRIWQLDDFRLVLTFRGSSEARPKEKTCHVLLSCKPDFARLSLVEDSPRASGVPLSFAQYLRAHLRRARTGSFFILDEDRQAALLLETKEGSFHLLLSILGPRSNVYLLDTDRILLYSMRPLEETRRDLARGKPWSTPQSRLTSVGSDRWADESDEGYLEAIERTYAQLERQKQLEDLSRKISHALNKEAGFLERKFGHLQQDLSRTSQAQECKRQGELLKTVLHAIKPGDGAVTATHYDTGEQITISLDPQLSPAQNLERYFARYQKELTRARRVEQQLADLNRARDEIEQLRSEFCSLGGGKTSDLQALESFVSGSRIRTLIARYCPSLKLTGGTPKKVSRNKGIAGRLLPKRYESADGLEIWVGRSDEGNDYLTTRLARGNDLFFHLEGSPGSHVVLRTKGREDPSSESILDACELAVHYSKQKKADQADVHVAPIKEVRKPKGAKPGLVNVLRGRTIHLRRDRKRLERVLASRFED